MNGYDHDSLGALLKRWVERGWLRSLDRALVAFLQEQDQRAQPLTLLSAALASHQLGRGHICLPLEQALADPDGILSLPPEGDYGLDGPPPRPSEVLQGLDLQRWQDALGNDALVGDGSTATPLVLSEGRLYLYRYWQAERRVGQAVRSRMAQVLDTPTDLPARLDALFGPLRNDAEAQHQDIHWQTVGAALAARSAFTVISGGPGTGKTTTVVRLLGLLQGLALETGRSLRIHLAAPTGKAAARLTESISAAVGQLPPEIAAEIPTTVTTVHRLLRPIPHSRRFRHHAANPLHLDLLVVDEASMVDLELMDALLDALAPRTRLILLGDKDQLSSVEAGAVLGELCRDAENPGYSNGLGHWLAQQTGYDLGAYQGDQAGAIGDHIALLRRSHRFGEHSGIGRLARAVNAQDRTAMRGVLDEKDSDDVALVIAGDREGLPDTVLDNLLLEGGRNLFHTRGDAAPQGYRHYLEIVARGAQDQDFDTWAAQVLEAFGQFQVLCALRKGPYGLEGLNHAIERRLRERGLLSEGHPWYAGRPVLVTVNDYGLGLMNGDIGIALPDPTSAGRLRVCFPTADGGIKRVLPSRLGTVETVFAMTVHKSQGSEFGHACLVLPERISPILTKELVYTGITRARRWFSLALSDLRILDAAIMRQTQRASGLGALLRQHPHNQETLE
ncbi:exodeoxyribonuclease V subunit alpha [Mangrovitalea sediminis]|uniref:exodeoxyribonuclease V subunit alpha n=1 Tax=Mangrovitalea sediminis TaxID=1982043 RepID=UPI000BE59C6C|nr:exodeoxyribonuclease V subunit alpha [Mangrovitalea sediminis]